MSAGKLVPKQSFGINPVTRNCLSFTQDHHVAYTSGHQVAVLNTETKEQQFLSGTSSYQHQSQGITAIVTSISRKLVAVAEKVDPTAIVTFYDGVTLRRKKVLTYSELGSNEIRCLAFSDDGKFLLTQGCGPEWNLVLWNIEKSIKVVTSVKISMSDDTPVYQISFCPWDSNVVVVLGKCILRLFRFTEGQLRPLSLTVRRDQATFIGHCWLPDDNLVLATEAGEVLLVENYEYRAVIYPPAGEQEELVPITCVGACSRGFVVGTGKGEIRLFEKQDDIKEKFQLDEAYPVPAEKGNIVTIAVGPDETLICATDKHQLLSLSLGNLNNSVKENTGGVFDNALTSFHCPNEAGKSAIIAIDTALWKHVIVSIGKDRSMRVWNAADKKMELIKLFDDEPISLSVHPSGLYVAVAFQDKVKVMSLLLEDIHLCREIAARQCSYVKFSKGGEYLAVSNGSNLQIHDTHTRNAVATLRGHNNKIRSAVWLNFDSKIMTVGAEGVIYFWDLFPVNRHMEHYAGNQPVSIGTGPADGTKAIIATHEKTVKEITFAAGQFVEMSNVKQNTNYSSTSGSANNSSEGAIYKPSQEIDLGSHVSCMLYDESRKMVIMGTDDPDNPGNIICALTSPQLNSSYDVNTLHSGPITALCMSYDGHAIYSGDTNGCLVISEFEKSYGGAQNKQRDGIISFEFIDEVLIHKTDLDAREGEITRLTLRVDELNQNNEHQLRLKEIEHKDKLREITEKFTSQLLSEKSKYEELESEKLSIEQDFNRKMKMLEDKQGDELRAIELKYKTKVNAEENRHKILLEETENAHRRWNEENQTLVESHQKYLQELTLEYEEKLLAEQRAQQDITSVKQHYKVIHDQRHDEAEADGDREIAEMKLRYDTKLKQEEETGIELMAQHALMKKNLQMLSKDSNQQKEDIRRLKDKETRLFETIHTLEKDIQSHKKEIREREETITDKEKRIFDLKKKNQELEKFRFVLDYKIKELKLQIAPRETEIATMRQQIDEMTLELEQYNKSNLALNLMIEELKLKLEGVKTEYSQQCERNNLNIALMEKIRRDLQDLWAARDDQNHFKNWMVKVYRIYAQEDFSPGSIAGGSSKKGDADDPQQLYNRDREQMERSLDSLRRAIKSEAMAHKRDIGKMMREGVLLTKEYNTLKKNYRSLYMQKKAIDSVGPIGPNNDLTQVMDLLGLNSKKNNRAVAKPVKDVALSSSTQPVPPIPRINSGSGKAKPRSAALRTITADGIVDPTQTTLSRQDKWEAWREIQMQYDQMRVLEEQLTALCHTLEIDPMQVIYGIDSHLLNI